MSEENQTKEVSALEHITKILSLTFELSGLISVLEGSDIRAALIYQVDKILKENEEKRSRK